MTDNLISPTEWQQVSVPNGTGFCRLKVPGGWLVLVENDVMHLMAGCDVHTGPRPLVVSAGNW